MAKIRRTIRKTKQPSEATFDEQFWPVMLSLFVLGGFLTGTVLAYLRFDERLWYANAWTWLFAIPIAICSLIWVLRKLESRALRRGVQFSAVLCVIVHLILFIVSVETDIFGRIWAEFTEIAETRNEREPLVEPVYDPVQFESQPDEPQDLLRPVETETPETELEQLEQEQQEPEPPTERQPTPTPEPEPTVRPNEIRRPTPAETVPRQATTMSQLSRKTSTAQVQPNQQVDTPRPPSQQSPSAATVSSQQSQLQRQANEAQPSPSMTMPETTAQAAPTVERARRTDQPAPNATAAAVPTMPRRISTPQAVPRTQVDSNATPSVARQTRPQAVAPANSMARRQETASPQVNRTATPPTPSPPTEVQATSQRREHESAPQPTMAQAPSPVANQRTRATSRPDVATVAAEVSPSASPSVQANPSVEATLNTVARTQSAANAQPTAAMAEPTEVVATATPTTSRAARTQAAPSPTATAQPTASQVARQSPTSVSSPATSAAAEATAATVASTPSAQIAAAASALRRQAVTSAQVAATEGSLAARSAAATAASMAGSATGPQRAANPTPAVTSAAASSTAARSTTSAMPNVVTTASSSPQAMSTASTGTATSVAASAASVSRQATSGVSTAGSNPSSGGPQLSPAANVVASSRAAAANSPTVNSQAAPSNSPARSARASDLAASPTNVDSPATAQSNPGEAAPTPEAARTAMTRSLNGMAGVGQAANLDRSLEAADSPSLVASGSVRRAEATQNTSEGAALAPSAPALVRHSLAGAQRPSASIRATTAEAATLAGSEQPSELMASSSGALTRANSDVASATVTAAAGQVQVDLGPTRVVSGGGASRAAGGGQPELNQTAQAQQLARNSSGGTPQPTLASNTVAAEATSPAGSGGGQPTPQGIAPTLAEVGRGEPSPTELGSGAAPSSIGELSNAAGAATVPANAVAGASQSRADSGSQVPEMAASGGASGDESEEDEEDRARRLARQAAGGAPQIAIRAEVIPGMAGGAPSEAVASAAPSVAEAAGEQVARSDTANSSASSASAGGPGRAGLSADEVAAGGGGELAGAVVVRRAEAADGVAGTPDPGGGTSSPSKASTTKSFTVNLAASIATAAGAPDSSGSPTGAMVDTSGPQASELTSGRSEAAGAATVGAAEGPQPVDGVADAGAIAGATSQSRSSTSSDGPSTGTESSTASMPRRATVGPAGLSGSLAGTIDVPSAPSMMAVARAELGAVGIGSDVGPMTRQAAGSLAVEVDAIEGPGGLGQVVASDVGLSSRRARTDSVQIQSKATRFVRQEIGGPPNVSTAALVSADAFRGRSKPGDSPASMGSAAGQQSDKAIELGLAYLARQQLADGSWNLQAVDHRAALVSDTAATGLALLAFQGYGYTHIDNQYAAVVKRAIDYLVEHQTDDGDLFIPLDDESNRSVWLYSHGIAALAMCEAYGMTQDPDLKVPAQKAVDFIVASQHTEYGGWRYTPGVESDTSVTGWMMMALKSGELANLEVPTETYARIERWLDESQGSRSERHKYRYNPYAPDTETQGHGRVVSETMTAVALLMRLYTGWRRDNENMMRGADYLLESPPEVGTARNPKRDTYYWYYATQVMFHMGGERWQKWNDYLRPVLVDSQLQSGDDAGSWNPRFPVADRWAPHAGRLYVTAMNLLSLEVHYRHLPLYDETAR